MSERHEPWCDTQLGPWCAGATEGRRAGWRGGVMGERAVIVVEFDLPDDGASFGPMLDAIREFLTEDGRASARSIHGAIREDAQRVMDVFDDE